MSQVYAQEDVARTMEDDVVLGSTPPRFTDLFNIDPGVQTTVAAMNDLQVVNNTIDNPSCSGNGTRNEEGACGGDVQHPRPFKENASKDMACVSRHKTCLLSYSNPHNTEITDFTRQNEFASAGLSYIGPGTRTRCLICSVWFNILQYPAVEHAHHSPHCEFMVLHFGQRFMAAVLVCTRNRNTRRLSVADVHRYMEDNGIQIDQSNQDLMTRFTLAEVRKLGFDPLQIYRALSALHQQSVPVSLDNMIKQLTRPRRVRQLMSGNITTPDIGDQEHPIRFHASAVSRNRPDPQPQWSSAMRGLTCALCNFKMVEVVVLPCGHAVMCVDCALGVSQCPICQSNIAGRNKLCLSVDALIVS